jgi:hypothetical protein
MMNRPRNLIFAATLAIVVGAVPQAYAQHRGGSGGHGGGGTVGRSASRTMSSNRQTVAPRVLSSVRAAPAYQSGSRGVVAGRSVSRVVVGGRVAVGPGGRFYAPYYAFRPRLRLGFGIFVGFPVSYPYYAYDPYYYPYGYAYPYPAYGYPSYPYPPSSYPAYPPSNYPAYPSTAYPSTNYPSTAPNSVSAQPGSANTGGVSFEITPSTAVVMADGGYVGTVGQFTPTTQPLALAPGRHHLEIRAPGYQTMAFDADIVAGQVIPYQGTLEQ